MIDPSHKPYTAPDPAEFWARTVAMAGTPIEKRLVAAMRDYAMNPWFPHATAKQVNEAEFEFCPEEDDDAMAVEVHPVYEAANCIGNFLVWEVGEPRRWWRLDAGRTPVLGIECVALAKRFNSAVVRLVWTPAEWREAYATEESCCILDWNCDIRRLFGDVTVKTDAPQLERVYARAWRGRKWGPRVKTA